MKTNRIGLSLESVSHDNFDPFKKGGHVVITGNGINKDVKIGLGVAKFLSEMINHPYNNSRIPYDFGKNTHYLDSESRSKWIKEILLPLGLVQEINTGTYVPSKIAREASYKFESAQKLIF